MIFARRGRRRTICQEYPRQGCFRVVKLSHNRPLEDGIHSTLEAVSDEEGMSLSGSGKGALTEKSVSVRRR